MIKPKWLTLKNRFSSGKPLYAFEPPRPGPSARTGCRQRSRQAFPLSYPVSIIGHHIADFWPEFVGIRWDGLFPLSRVPAKALIGLVLPVRIELTTSPLPRGCSTTELRQP